MTSSEQEFLNNYHPEDYEKPSVAVDLLVFTIEDAALKLVMIRREEMPFQNKLALPGVFVNIRESLEEAAYRGIEEETGLTDIYLEQLYTWGDPERDPRMRIISVSYMALVPIVQPPVIRLCTTKKERLIRMPYQKGSVSKTTKILFPIVVTMLAGLVAPASVALVGFLMFGNLLRECGVLNALSETAQNVLANLITIVLGLTVAGQMTADKFVRPDTLLILALGLVAFIFDTAGGVFFAKLLNLFLPEGKKINPMIGAAGISAFPMSGRVVNQMGLAEDNQNFLLMYSISVNVSGQIASVIAGGLILTLMSSCV